MLDNCTREAYSEVHAFLEILGENYKKKIPTEIMNEIKNNKAIEYNPTYNLQTPIEKQSFKKDALAIIAFLDLNYWCTENEKKKIQNIFLEKDRLCELEKRKLYNPDNLFLERNKKIEERIKKHEKMSLIEVKKENLIKQFLNKIKNYFIEIICKR